MDIVDRLRSSMPSILAMRDAANEIERLRNLLTAREQGAGPPAEVDPFTSGIAAWHTDMGINDNPYPFHSDDYEQWREGWTFASLENSQFGAGA